VCVCVNVCVCLCMCVSLCVLSHTNANELVRFGLLNLTSKCWKTLWGQHSLILLPLSFKIQK
jgi:hypothetical protein